MGTMTLQQQQAIARARARMRAQQGGQPQAQPQPAEQLPNEVAKASQPLSAGETALDIAKSGASGVGEGAVNLAGTPGDLRNMGENALGWVANKLGSSPSTQDIVKKAVRFTSPFAFAPTSEQIKQPINSMVQGGLDYQPQTTAGNYAKTIGEFAPSAALGPGGAVRKAAMAVIPGVASEAAGQATKGTPFEQYARGAGALLGGVASAGKGGAAVKQMISEAPTAENIASKTNEMYTNLRNVGIKYDANEFDRFASQVVSTIGKDLRQAQAPKAHDAMQQIVESVGTSPDFTDIESMRRTAGKLAVNPDATERHFGKALSDAIDNFQESSPLVSDGSIPAGQVAARVKEARAMAQKNIKGRKIAEMVDAAKSYQSGYESGLRNQFSNLSRRIAKGKERGWTQAEKDAIHQVAKGTVASNALGTFGKAGLDFSNLGHRAALLPAGLAFLAADFLTTGGLGTAVKAGAAIGGASAAKFAARKMTEKSVSNLGATIRAGKLPQLAARKADSQEALKIWLRRALTASEIAR